MGRCCDRREADGCSSARNGYHLRRGIYADGGVECHRRGLNKDWISDRHNRGDRNVAALCLDHLLSDEGACDQAVSGEFAVDDFNYVASGVGSLDWKHAEPGAEVGSALRNGPVERSPVSGVTDQDGLRRWSGAARLEREAGLAGQVVEECLGRVDDRERDWDGRGSTGVCELIQVDLSDVDANGK